MDTDFRKKLKEIRLRSKRNEYNFNTYDIAVSIMLAIAIVVSFALILCSY